MGGKVRILFLFSLCCFHLTSVVCVFIQLVFFTFNFCCVFVFVVFIQILFLFSFCCFHSNCLVFIQILSSFFPPQNSDFNLGILCFCFISKSAFLQPMFLSFNFSCVFSTSVVLIQLLFSFNFSCFY